LNNEQRVHLSNCARPAANRTCRVGHKKTFLGPAHVHTFTHGQLRKAQHMYVNRAVRKAHFKMNWAFKVIPGHPYWCRQKSRTVIGRNVQFVRRHGNGKTAKSSISATPVRMDALARNAFEHLQWLILPETRLIDLYFCCDSIGLCLLLFAQLSLKFEPSESKTASTKTEFYMK